MPKLSVIIPYMESFPEKRQILERCCQSFTGADEIIIVSNWREGYAIPINKGLAVAKGDFMVIMNDDMVWDGGSLKRLCDESAVTSPSVNGNSTQKFWGCSWCIPRWVYEKLGGMDERFQISYFDDDDTFFTYASNNIPMYCKTEVKVETKGGTTLDKFHDRNEFFAINRQKFIDKWGKTPEEMYQEYPIR